MPPPEGAEVAGGADGAERAGAGAGLRAGLQRDEDIMKIVIDHRLVPAL